MTTSADSITDIWFRSSLKLEEIASALGWSDVHLDAEDYWEWAIGTLDGVELDVTRTHRRRPGSVDTRIFRLDNQPFSAEQRDLLRVRLLEVIRGEIFFGKWISLRGHEFERRVVESVRADD